MRRTTKKARDINSSWENDFQEDSTGGAGMGDESNSSTYDESNGSSAPIGNVEGTAL
jgi:hypothetical protein